MYYPDNSKELRMYVKIRFHKKNLSLCKEAYYFRNNMTLDFFNRWKWYFKYRAALIQVQNPHSPVEFEYGSYEYILPSDEYQKKMVNRLLSAKRNLTKYENKLNFIKENWDELFPIEEHPKWKNVVEKLNYYKEYLHLTQKEYDKANSDFESSR